jgi:MFS family permease
MSTTTTDPAAASKSPLHEIIQPFIDVVRAPRALWGINLAYFIEGLVYFGILGYLAIHFTDYIFQGQAEPDVLSHKMVAVLTAGITFSMFLLGFVPDKWGVRFALVLGFVLLLLGRVLMSAAPTIMHLPPAGLWSPLNLVTMGGILVIVVGYGMYQPAAYAAVRQFTTPKTAGMGFAMLYALMNLGGWLPTFAFLLRDEKWMNLGITGVFWVYTGLTLVALLATLVILTPQTIKQATAAAKAETAALQADQPKPQKADAPSATTTTELDQREFPPLHMWAFAAAVLVLLWWRLPSAPVTISRFTLGAGVLKVGLPAVLAAIWLVLIAIPPTRRFLARHPLSDIKFFFFIFALIPVQTLFTYNWLILPQYISRAFAGGWIGEYFEIASNANPLLIFFLVPIVTALTQKAPVYRMMIIGTLVMASAAFFLAIGPHPSTLLAFIVIMTVGEAMWQPRFLQYAAEIAPEGRTGQYMGVAQLPWFLTKMLVPMIYSGEMLARYCPPHGTQDTRTMWLIFALIAITSPILLILAKGWIGKSMKQPVHATAG